MEEEYSLLLRGEGEGTAEELVDVDGAKSIAADRLVVKESSSERNRMASWTREETETLMELAHKYELRWPVIIDRWHARFNVKDGKRNEWSAQRKVEDLQYRYYYVGNVLARKRLEGVVAQMSNAANGAGTGTSADKTANVAAATTASDELADNSRPAPKNYNNPPLDNAESNALQTISQNLAIHPTLTPNLPLPATGTALRSKPFDLFAERSRRAQLHHIWNRPKEEEKEEEELRAELRAVEGQLRKLKKSGRYLIKSGAANAGGAMAQGETKSSSVKHRKSADSAASVAADPHSNTEQFLNASFRATAPVPTPGTPYLQSGRLFPPACGGQGLNKSTLKQMDDILKELGVQEPICTKRACDLYDGVRKDVLTLLVLKKVVLRKEAEVAAKRSKLVGVLGVGATTSVAEESHKKAGKSKEEKPNKPEVVPVASTATATPPSSNVNVGAAVQVAKKSSGKISSSAGKTLSSGKKGLPAAGQPKKKAAKKPSVSTATPPTMPSSSVSNAAPSSATLTNDKGPSVNPLHDGKMPATSGSTATALASASMAPQPSVPSAPTTSISNLSSPSKTGKKRGRPTTSKSPMAPAGVASTGSGNNASSVSPVPTAGTIATGTALSSGKMSGKKRAKKSS
ncbi:hypothetical protein ACHAWX_005800 [Stephanocyclus meneghinianus]